MKKIVTKRQRELLSIIYEYIKDTGYPPTFEEMKKKLEVVSNQSVVDLLEKLKNHRLIKRDNASARSIAILPLGYKVLSKPPLVPFLGLTSAGMPMETVEVAGEWQAVSAQVAQLKANIFLLKISGDSMINAGINDGDLVLVEQRKEFMSGEIVLAQVGEESTIKRFISQDKPPYLYLKPENPNYPIQLFTDEVRLTGKVISMFRNGSWKPIK